jgi:putative alpha-1,2-mannosidase
LSGGVFFKLFINLFMATALLSSFGCQRSETQYTDHVNLFIGTLDRSNAVPAATAPFGMISCGPDNVFDEVADEYTSRAGYNYKKEGWKSRL